jgi:hypothetical protein
VADLAQGQPIRRKNDAIQPPKTNMVPRGGVTAASIFNDLERASFGHSWAGESAPRRHRFASAQWVDGQNLRVEVRWNASDATLAKIYAAQLAGLQPDVILSASTTNLGILREATNTIPIVFVQVSDPVAQGFVSNLTHPGGNITGFSAFDFSIGGK